MSLLFYPLNHKLPSSLNKKINLTFIFLAGHCVSKSSPYDLKIILGEHNAIVSGDGEQYFYLEQIIRESIKFKYLMLEQFL